MRNYFISIFLIITLFSCVEKKTKEIQPNKTIISTVKEQIKPIKVEKIEESTPFNDLINTFPSKSLPNIDTTDFDNYSTRDYFNVDEIEILQLKKIEEEIYSLDHISGLYSLNISNQFKTIVVISQSEHELKTILVNYSLKGNLIDFIEIAYDEIAEGWSRKTGEIDSTKIVITDILWLEEKQVNIKEFKVLKTGEIDLNLKRFRTGIRPNEVISIHKEYKDIIEFDAYNDNYDYMYLYGKIENSDICLIYKWQGHDTGKYHFNKGDLIEITWKMDSIWIAGDGERLDYAEWAMDAKKVKDGKTTQFLKNYTKPIAYINYDVEYTDSHMDDITNKVEYYIANSKNKLVIAHIKDPSTEFIYSIEERERNDKHYTVIGIANNFESHLNTIQWLFIELNSSVLYEYDLVNDKLIEFKTF